jgi:hypothetical protein
LQRGPADPCNSRKTFNQRSADKRSDFRRCPSASGKLGIDSVNSRVKPVNARPNRAKRA